MSVRLEAAGRRTRLNEMIFMRLWHLLAPLCLLAAFAWTPAIASASVDATMTTLDDGLTVIIAPVHSAPAATVGVLYKTGSRNETPWTTGVAHQVEHMMFKGTTDLLKPGDIDRLFYDNNGATDQDETYYYESFEKSGLENALRIEADRMENASFEPAQLIAENSVVISELDDGAGNPAEALDEQVVAAAMQVHQYHWPVIGWKSVVATFGQRRDLVYDFYVNHYAPQNAVLVVAGDVEPAAALALVHTYFDAVARRPVQPLPIVVEPMQHGTRRVNVAGPGSADRLELAYHVPGGYDADAYALDVLDAVLSGGESSRLYNALVSGGYAADLTTAPNAAVDPFLYTIAATIEQDTTPDKARSIIESEVRKLGARPITAAELAKAKKQVIAAHVFAHDGIEGLAEELAAWQAWTGDWRNDDRFAERIAAVSAAQVQNVARRYLIPYNLTVGVYVANTKAAGARTPVAQRRLLCGRALFERAFAFRPCWRGWVPAAAAVANTTSFSPAASDSSAPSSSATANTSGPQRSVLPNGLVLIVQKNHANPSVVIETNTVAGSAFDMRSRSGLAALTQEMLLRGTTSRSYEQFEAALDALGSAISTSLAIDGAGFSTQALAADEPKALALVADMLQHPRFALSDFGDAQSQLITDRRTALTDPLTVSREALYRGLYPSNSAWSLPSDGTIAGLGALRLSDARAFYAAHYAPNDTVVVVSGDVDAATVRQQAQALFGAWRKGGAPRPNLAAKAVPPSPPRTLVNGIPGAARVEVFAGAAGLAPDMPDLAAPQLMGFILGGGSLVSRLLHQVRDVDGYVYTISARFTETGFGPGPWTLHFGASPRNVKLALAESIAQMRALQRETVSEADLAQYRRLAVDAVLTGELSNQGIADELLHDESLGRGLDYPANLTKAYAAVTPAQIQSAAQAYLHPDDLLISAAGAKF